MSWLLDDDKQKHLWFSALMCILLVAPAHFTLMRLRPGHASKAPLLATMATLMIGGLKEIADAVNVGLVSRCPCRAEVLDFVADMIGTFAGCLVVLIVRERVKWGGGGGLPLHEVGKNGGV